MAAACQPTRTVTLALLGDINLGRAVNPTLDSFAFLSSSLSTADLALANLESPLGEAPESDLTGYNLCAPAEHASLLAGWGLDLLALANNHADDCNQDGITATQSALAAAGLTGLSPQPVRLEVNGLRLTFFAFDDISAPLDAEAAAEAIRIARAEGSLVIVSVHWGAEYQGAPTTRQEAVATLFAEAGAHLIWGHHPHVLQPAAWLDASPGRSLVLYSLGNALFDMGGLDDTRQSALVLVTLDADGVRTVEAVPFVIDPPHSRLLEPDAETAEKILARMGLE
jgi:poly-gamma-glutamate synthesis protein (capsule biosynthesis protein)